jgi:hypothetical protein
MQHREWRRGIMHYKRFTIGLAAGILLVLALLAVVGVGTAGAAPVPAKTYCIDGQTVTLSDLDLQAFLDSSIKFEGGALTSNELPWAGPDPDASSEAGETFAD